jgi:hypothetical protein
MDEYINQLRRTAQARIPYFTLMGTLSLIDICAALNSENGETKGSKFKGWYAKYLSSYHSGSNHSTNFDAEDCYKLRCRILHQGRAEMDHDKIDNQVKSGKVAFRLGPGKVHKCISNGLYYLDIEIFMEDVITAVTEWEKENRDNPVVIRNKSKMMKIIDHDPGKMIGNGTYIY